MISQQELEEERREREETVQQLTESQEREKAMKKQIEQLQSRLHEVSNHSNLSHYMHTHTHTHTCTHIFTFYFSLFSPLLSVSIATKPNRAKPECNERFGTQAVGAAAGKPHLLNDVIITSSCDHVIPTETSYSRGATTRLRLLHSTQEASNWSKDC